MARIAVTVSSYDPTYLEIFEHLVRAELRDAHEVTVLDITPLLAAPVDSFHRGILHMFGFLYPGHDIDKRMADHGADYIRATATDLEENSGPLDDALEELLSTSVKSALSTYFRTDRPNLKSIKVSRTKTALLNEGRASYRVLRQFCSTNPGFELAYVPNGRFPHQKLATLAFQDAGVPTRHIEKGEGPQRAYVQDYAPQNRHRSQGSVETVLDGVSAEGVEAIAHNWMARRAPSKESENQFSSLWSHAVPQAIMKRASGKSKIAGFFTSSQDEFQFLGTEWERHDWSDQYAAFDVILTKFEAAGYTCYLRVHPNLATKAHDCFLRERDGIRQLALRHPALTVIWHDDSTNTYSLLDNSDAVVVWGSTVGLEASARGIPVWTTATARYGLVADIRELLSSEDVESIGVEPWEVDSHSAKRFIAYLVLRDQTVSPSNTPWHSWGSERLPFGVNLAAIAVSGGIPYPSSAIKALFDVYRHRGLRPNIRARRRG